MEAATTQRKVTSGGVERVAFFGISNADQTHIMTILRDTLYTDRILAVLREYAANAWDSHRQSGKADIPIKVTLPTDMNPTLYIRDFGAGMTPDDIFRIYSQYGASTKRGDNIAVGMMGIGSKSGFAYSDTFTVVSWNGGMKRVYVALLDETDRGTINLLAEEPCEDETGIEIQVPVKRQDIYEFQTKARSLFHYFTPRPDINLELNEVRYQTILEDGFVDGLGYQGSRGWVAVMGCIPYRINLQQVSDDLTSANILKSLEYMSGGLYFDIGDVQVNASREELKYSEQTKKAIVDKFCILIRDYTVRIIKDLSLDTLTAWEKRIQGVGLKQRMQGCQLPLAMELQEYIKEEVPLKNQDAEGKPCSPKSFVIISSRCAQQVDTIQVRPDSVLYVKDDDRSIHGYALPFRYDAYIIRPTGKASLKEVYEELAVCLKYSLIEGIKQQNTSTLSWTAPEAGTPGVPNVKHKVNQFRLIGSDTYPPLSDNWTVEFREPTEADVFVVLHRFNVVTKTSLCAPFYSDYAQDARMAKLFGVEMPPVYGYKNSAKSSVSEKDCVGTPYYEWRKSFFKKCLTPKVRHAAKQMYWATFLQDYNEYRLQTVGEWQRLISSLAADLGERHPIVTVLAKGLKARLFCDKFASDYREALLSLSKIAGLEDPSKNTLKNIWNTYPLMRTHYHKVRVLWKEDKKLWLDYVHLVDEFNKMKSA